jgi:hypothetical protein
VFRCACHHAWAAFDAPRRDLVKDGEDPESAVSALVPGLLAGTQAALLLEASMSVPVPVGQPGAWCALGKARRGERNRPWSAGAGAGVLATGLAQGAWMLRQLAPAGCDDTARCLAVRGRAVAAGRGVHHRGGQAGAVQNRNIWVQVSCHGTPVVSRIFGYLGMSSGRGVPQMSNGVIAEG